MRHIDGIFKTLEVDGITKEGSADGEVEKWMVGKENKCQDSAVS